MKTLVRPAFVHFFEALDVGFVDRTGWIAGYVDFLAGVVVIEDEFLLSRATTQDIADAIEAHERALWGESKFAGGHIQPYRRVSDVDHRLIADLRQKHALSFSAIEKKNFASDINLVNVLITGKQLVISEKCVHLRRQLREGVYNTTRKDMAKDALGGHYDMLAALRYGCRLAEGMLRISPFPAGFTLPRTTADTFTPIAQPKPLAILPDTNLGRKLDGFSRGVMGRLFGARRG